MNRTLSVYAVPPMRTGPVRSPLTLYACTGVSLETSATSAPGPPPAAATVAITSRGAGRTCVADGDAGVAAPVLRVGGLCPRLATTTPATTSTHPIPSRPFFTERYGS